MSAWSNVRTWLGLHTARRGARPTFRPMLEELEARLPPGDLLSTLTSAGAGLMAPSWASGDLSSNANNAAADVGTAPAAGGSPVETTTAAAGATTASPRKGATAASASALAGGSSSNAPGSDSADLLQQLALSPAFRAGRAVGGMAVTPPLGFVPSYLFPLTEPFQGIRTARPFAEVQPALMPVDPLPVVPLSNAAWSLIGPGPLTGGQIAGAGNVSGRVAGIAADPTNANIIYMAAAGGGVWKTSDGGATWAPLTDTQSTLFMGAIAVAPSSPNVIYAGTGEATNSGLSFYGRGVLKSSDGGATWMLLNDAGAFDRSTISKIAVSPTDPNTLYVALSNNGVNGNGGVVTGVYKSSDGGATWTNTTTAIANVTAASQFSDVVIDPANANTLYCAVGDAGGSAANGVYVSNNAGGTWAASGNFSTLGANDGVIKLAISASTPADLFASASDAGTQGLAFVAKTVNGGTTWATASPGVNYMGGQGFYDQAVAIDPANPLIAYVGGAFNGTDANGNFTNQVLETQNGGTSWTDITIGADGNGVHPDHHAMTFDAAGKLLDGNDGGIWRLDNNALTAIHWTDLNTNLATLQIIGLALHPTDPNTAYAGMQDNGTNKFTGAVPWMQVRGGDGGFVRVDPSNPLTVYHTFFRVAGSTTFIERSDDGGATWTDISAGITAADNSDFYPPYQMDQSNPSRLILGTDHLYETLNKGATWRIIGTKGTAGFAINNTIDAIGLSQSAPNTIYVGDDQGNIFVTNNDGATWVQHNIPTVTDHINELVVDPANTNSVYAVRDLFGPGKVFHSTNGGVTWTDISGNLPNLPTYSLALNTAANMIYVGNDNGVFATNNGGASWAPFGAGLPNVQVRELQFNPTLNILAAATHGRSAWEISTAAGGGGGGGGGGGFGQELEPNQTSDTAIDFGALTSGQVTNVISEGIVTLPDGRNDYDWYRWEPTQTGVFSAIVNTTAGSDLELHLFTLVGNTLVEVTKDVRTGVNSRAVVAAFTAGQPIFVEVKGHNASFGVMTQAVYNMTAAFG